MGFSETQEITGRRPCEDRSDTAVRQRTWGHHSWRPQGRFYSRAFAGSMVPTIWWCDALNFERINCCSLNPPSVWWFRLHVKPLEWQVNGSVRGRVTFLLILLPITTCVFLCIFHPIQIVSIYPLLVNGPSISFAFLKSQHHCLVFGIRFKMRLCCVLTLLCVQKINQGV